MDSQLQGLKAKCLCSTLFTLAKYGLSVVNFLVMVAGCCMIVIATIALQERALMTSADDTPPNPSVFMITLGAVMVIVGFFGCLSPLRENVVLLKCFSACVMLMFVLEVTGGALTFIYLRAVSRSVSKFIMDSIVVYQEYERPRDTVDYIQTVYNCCGSESYTDWEKNLYYECNSMSQASCGVPPSCCKVRENLQCGLHTRGYGRLYAAHSIYTEGCVHYVVSNVRNYLIVVGSIALGVGCIELLSLIMAGILIKNILVIKRGGSSHRSSEDTNCKYYSDDEHELTMLEEKAVNTDTTQSDCNSMQESNNQPNCNSTFLDLESCQCKHVSRDKCNSSSRSRYLWSDDRSNSILLAKQKPASDAVLNCNSTSELKRLSADYDNCDLSAELEKLRVDIPGESKQYLVNNCASCEQTQQRQQTRPFSARSDVSRTSFIVDDVEPASEINFGHDV